MNAIVERVKNNPAVVLTLLAALFGVAAAFGLELTKEQTASITALVTVLVGFLVRAQVTPTRKVGALADDHPGPAGDLMAGPASDVPTGDPVDVVAKDDYSDLGAAADEAWRNSTSSGPPGTGMDPRGETGAYDTGSLLVALACIVVIIAGLIFIFRALA